MNKKNSTTEEFIQKARKVHGNKYDYSKVVYVNNSTKVKIICPDHGEFLQTPKSHLKGSNCNKCNNNKIKEKTLLKKINGTIKLKPYVFINCKKNLRDKPLNKEDYYEVEIDRSNEREAITDDQGNKLTTDYIWSKSGEEREKLVDWVFNYYKNKGFPYLQYEEDYILNEFKKVKLYDVNKMKYLLIIKIRV